MTTIWNDPALKPAAEALIAATWEPSAIPSATPRIVNGAEAAPAGIVTVAGTTASVALELASVTTSGSFVAVLRTTRPSTTVPSRTETEAAVTVSVGPSLSSTASVTEAVPLSRTAPELVVG